MLFGKKQFREKLLHSWPKRSDQTRRNVGDPGYDPPFAYGFGLPTKDDGHLAAPTEARSGAGDDRTMLFARDKVTGGRRLLLGAAGQTLSTNLGSELIAQSAAYSVAQEDSVRIACSAAPPPSSASPSISRARRTATSRWSSTCGPILALPRR